MGLGPPEGLKLTQNVTDTKRAQKEEDRRGSTTDPPLSPTFLCWLNLILHRLELLIPSKSPPKPWVSRAPSLCQGGPPSPAAWRSGHSLLSLHSAPAPSPRLPQAWPPQSRSPRLPQPRFPQRVGVNFF